MEATTTKERPILFSGPMVRAILDGRKTMTRRIIKPQPERMPVQCMYSKTGWAQEGTLNKYGNKGCSCHAEVRFPGWWPGTRLWVRETWRAHDDAETIAVNYAADDSVIYFGPHAGINAKRFSHLLSWQWKPSIHMPRWASRLTLEITSVRVERLQDISEEDAKAEGVEKFKHGWKNYIDHESPMPQASAADSFCALWESINGRDSWSANPWVWVLTFRVVSPETYRK